jgi:hypothetical protein
VKKKFTVAIVTTSKTDLVVTNPRVIAIARHMYWRPDTLVRRVERALPAKMEQRLYLALAASVRIYPESLAKILREIMGIRELTVHDLVPVRVGKNLTADGFTPVVELLQETLWLVGRIGLDYQGVSVGMVNAARIVRVYGQGGVESVIDSIAQKLEAMEGMLGLRNRSWEYAMTIAIHFFASAVLPWCEERCIPYPLDFGEFLDTYGDMLGRLQRRVGKGDRDE